MSATLSLTESQTLTALRTFLTGLLPAGVEVVRGQTNRVPEPAGADFVVMTPILRQRLATNTDTYTDTYPGTTQTAAALTPMRVTVQLDVHGPASADNAQMIVALFRDDYAVQALAASGFDVAPMYCDDGKQIPYLNAEQQVEYRWSIDAVLQCNPVVTVPQQFAGSLDITLVEVDAAYPP